jgi:hypothetical protein
MKKLAVKIASRYILAQMGTKYYKFDMNRVRQVLQRHRVEEQQQAQQYGFFTQKSFGLIPIAWIAHKRVWNPGRISKIREGIRRRVYLPPVELAQKGPNRFEIVDGIHRLNASIEQGFTHIPAFYTVTVETPHLKTTAKPPMRRGTWVQIEHPTKDLDFGVVLGHVGRTSTGNTHKVLAIGMVSDPEVVAIPEKFLRETSRIPPVFAREIQRHPAYSRYR